VFISLGILPVIGLAALLAFDAVIARRKAAPSSPRR
jgi:hypothetical protein